jgi:hypothetical protein
LTGETTVLGEKLVVVLVYGIQTCPSANLSTTDLSQYHFACHISHVNWPGTESRLTTSSVSHNRALGNYVCAKNI